MSWIDLTPLVFIPVYAYTNHFYKKIHGRRLKWYMAWASHGALFWRMRLPRWEKPDVPRS